MPANVRSFEAIRIVRDEVTRFGRKASDGMDELAGEVRRVLDWVEHDRPGYWKTRVSKAHDAVTEAKNNLHRCLMYPMGDEQPSCAEERAALRKAEAHLAYCREKQERVFGWSRTLRHELHEYEGRIGKLRAVVELESPRVVALLDRTLEALEKYAAGAPSGPAPTLDPAAAPDPSGDAVAPATLPPADQP